MWANENWTRRWDGSDQEVLIRQDYDAANDAALVDCFAGYFADPRYIRIDGRPVLMVYRAADIPDTVATLARWRGLFAARHNEAPLLVMAQSFDALDPREFGFDAAVEFPPHKLVVGLERRNAELRPFDPRLTAHVYDYDDMVAAQHRLLTEGLGLRHVRMILGNSMGGMHTWVWGTTHPDFMDVLVPMASTPNPMSGRNWMMRRFIIDAIRQDPAWMNGHYTTQPPSLQFANVFFTIATNGGDQGLYRKAPTREQADRWLDQSLRAPSTADANNHLYLWEASRDFNPNPHLEKIKATVLAINSADDERNPPSLGLMEKALQRMPTARLFLIPASDQTSGHGTTGQAKWWKDALASVLRTAPKRPATP